jgi:hypothetical protein
MNRVHLALGRDTAPIAAAPAAGESLLPVPRAADRGMGGALADGLKKLLGRN